MVPRPTSITIIAWLLIGLGFLGAFGWAAALVIPGPGTHHVSGQNPIPVPIQYGLGLAGIVIDLVSGYFMLRGRNWTRYLYVVWAACRLFIGLLISPVKLFMIPGVAVLAAITFFLCRPAANAFFATGGKGIDPRSIPSTRRMVGILFYFIAGFFFACTAPIALMSFGVGTAKTAMLCVFFLPFAICLAIGRWLSAEENWKRDVGICVCGVVSVGRDIRHHDGRRVCKS